MACNHGELLEAARAVALYLSLSTDPPPMSDLMLRPPSMSMRQAADELDRKDTAIRRLRAALKACE